MILVEYKYIFSIVMAIYNSEPFLRETLDSIVNQRIKGFELPFEEIVQVIMVDDGSNDGTAEIIDEYSAMYSNFISVHKLNGGVASARNEGLKYVEGKYTNFLDSGDKFSDNVLWKIYNFFEKKSDRIDVVAIPIKFIGQDKYKSINSINNTTKKNAVITLADIQPNCDISASCAFFLSDALHDIIFDERLKYDEDRKFFFDVVLKKRALGVVTEAKYMLRMHDSKASLSQSCQFDSEWYLNYFKYYIMYFINKSISEYGFVPLYVQNTLFSLVCPRFKKDLNIYNILGECDAIKYKELLSEFMSYIDDEIVLNCAQLYVEHKFYALSLKYKLLNCSPMLERFKEDDTAVFFRNTRVLNLSHNLTKIDFVDINKNQLVIEGYTVLLPVCDFEVVLSVKAENGDTFFVPCEYNNRDVNKYLCGETILYGKSFIGKFNITDDNIKKYIVSICCVLEDGTVIKKENFKFGKMCSLGKEYKNAYYANLGMAVSFSNNAFVFEKCDKKHEKIKERNFRRELWKTGRKGERKAVLVRTMYRFIKSWFKKDIWLISDRLYRADDNGEAFFKYVMQRKDKRIKAYFLISDKCDDYKRMVKIGPVVKPFSWKHKMIHLLAGKIISSQGQPYITNPFSDRISSYRDLMQKQSFIFLQHGVIKDDLSDWLNRYNKGIDGFITSAGPEYRSILDYKYFYTEKEVWLTGLPRHDFLYNDPKRYITVMPTWRKYLSVGRGNGLWNMKDSFTVSEYYCFYNSLINDQRLLDAAEKYHYTICFMPHPNVISWLDTFEKNDHIIFLDASNPYKKVFAESNLVITDYSSAVFDFLYLRKPVIYCQFDVDSFFSGEHSYIKGYFDYERDGFGEVEYDLDSTVNRIIEYMQSNCELKDKYRKRIDDFLSFNDKKNSERIFNRIIALNERDN